MYIHVGYSQVLHKCIHVYCTKGFSLSLTSDDVLKLKVVFSSENISHHIIFINFIVGVLPVVVKFCFCANKDFNLKYCWWILYSTVSYELFTISETFSKSGDSLHRETIFSLIQTIVSSSGGQFFIRKKRNSDVHYSLYLRALQLSFSDGD